MLSLLAQKENWKEQSFLGRKHYRKDHPYFWERVSAGKSCMEIRTIIRLSKSPFFAIEMISKSLLDKAKPFVRRDGKNRVNFKQLGFFIFYQGMGSQLVHELFIFNSFDRPGGHSSKKYNLKPTTLE